ncbi:hypothetical protein BJX62DRAFT_45769 [Aspergillus germanicus]
MQNHLQVLEPRGLDNVAQDTVSTCSTPLSLPFLLPRCISRFIRASALIRSSPEEWSILISRMVSTLHYFCSPMTPSQALTDPTIPKKGSQGSQPNGDRCGGFSVESYYTGLEIAARITTDYELPGLARDLALLHSAVLKQHRTSQGHAKVTPQTIIDSLRN